ncbi:MAG TPA: tRNA preQ1(34) S-adenosylmethionine ribosyltransferase-isomerase QueA [Longimicrobiales bacterium]
MRSGIEHYTTSDFDYELPPGRIAQHPLDRRDESRLLVLDRAGGPVRHHIFRDLVQLIPAGDALVLNETRVFPARLVGRKPSGAAAEVLLLRPLDRSAAGTGIPHASPKPASRPLEPTPNLWEALVRPGGKLKPGRVVQVADDLHVEIVDSTSDGSRIVRLVTPLPVEEALERHGRVPLPPYIDREPGPADAERYQTVYARERGSVAAPTAGLHFTQSLLTALEEKGVRLGRLVLHVGVGTFRPVESEDPARHHMHAEHYAISEETAAALNETRRAGGRIWAVGTTVARVLETVADADGILHAGSGETALFIRPPYRFRGVDRLITNFHLPRSTLLMLVAAFGGYAPVMRAYGEAVEAGYRFYSYGDAMAVV